MNLYIVRHGQTEWNVIGRMQGSSDIPLNRAGRQQAENVAKRFASLPLDAAYSSPLSRAYDTAAAIVRGRSLVIEKEPALIEVGFGVWEGKSFEEMDTVYAQPFHAYMNDPENNPAQQGGDDMRLRLTDMRAFLQRLLQQYTHGENVLLVTHGFAIRILLSVVMEAPLSCMSVFFMGNTSISVIRYEQGRPRIELLGDCSHNPEGIGVN